MKPALPLTALAISVWLAGCATSVPMTGQTRAGEELRQDVASHLRMLAPVTVDCPPPRKVTAITASTGDPRAGAPQRSDAVVEIWTATVCDQPIPFRITFIPAVSGGTDFRVERLKP
jgi:hypothetical protein